MEVSEGYPHGNREALYSEIAVAGEPGAITRVWQSQWQSGSEKRGKLQVGGCWLGGKWIDSPYVIGLRGIYLFSSILSRVG